MPLKLNDDMMRAAPALLHAAMNMIGSSVNFYEYNGEPKVELRNDRWVFVALLAAVAEAEGDRVGAQRLRESYPEPKD